MDEIILVLAALARIAVVPLVGFAVVRLARRWPVSVLTALVVLIVVGIAALWQCAETGYGVDPVSRRMEFGSELGRWCFALGGVLLTLGFPALPLVAFARAPNGPVLGPVGGQWAALLFGYFLTCSVFAVALYSALTGIIK